MSKFPLSLLEVEHDCSLCIEGDLKAIESALDIALQDNVMG